MAQGALGLDQVEDSVKSILEGNQLLQLGGGWRERGKQEKSLWSDEVSRQRMKHHFGPKTTLFIVPFRITSLLSSKIATNLDIPRGAVKMHSSVLSGRADSTAASNCKEYRRE